MFKQYLFIFILLFSCLIAKNKYQIDATHSSINFAVSHLTISKAKGNIGDFAGNITISKKGITDFNLSAEVKSIDTNNKKRDAHLKNADFLEVETYPKAKLVFKKYNGNREKGQLIADLTLKDVTKKVTFEVSLSPEITHPVYKNKVVGVSLNTTINRLDFKIGDGEKYANKKVIGHEVTLEFNLEVTR